MQEVAYKHERSIKKLLEAIAKCESSFLSARAKQTSQLHPFDN